MRIFIPLILTLTALGCGAPRSPLLHLQPEARSEKLARDGRAVATMIRNLEALMDRARAARLFDDPDDVTLAVARRDQLRQFFASFLDLVVSLDTVRRYYADRGSLDADADAEAFLIAYTADLALYVNMAEVLDKATGKRGYEQVLDEPSPEFGIRAGSWRHLKTSFNLQPFQRPLALQGKLHRARAQRYVEAGVAARHPELMSYADTRYDLMIKAGLEHPAVLTREWGDLIGSGAHAVWFPAQAGVAEWMGDTRVRRKGQALISRPQIEAMRPKLRPGDLLLERRNWYLSNIGLPGFWPHVALYLGTPAEAEAVLGLGVIATLRGAHPEAFDAWAQTDAHGDAHRVIEAMSEGIVFTSLEHSADADYVAVIRPRLPPQEIARAMDRALGYHRRPYDLDFDFLTDRALVCSELVYKAFEPDATHKGLKLPLTEVLGRPTLPPTLMARQYTEEHGTEAQQFDFVYFLDGHEAAGRAELADEAAFLESHARPKWDMSQR